jgi:hypothetical protein
MITKRWDGRLQVADLRRMSEAPPRGHDCGHPGGHPGEQALEAIFIPEEDSRLHARARVDFGPVPVNGSLWASIAGNFRMRIHVPRTLQQQISGNGFVGSVLGSARITADISERVGSMDPDHPRAELCLFVDFHETGRGNWMVDLRVLQGAKLRVPLSGSAKAIGTLGHIDLTFDQDTTTSLGPIVIQSASVADLWRSIRDEVRAMLVHQVVGSVSNRLVLARTGSRNSSGSEAMLRVWRDTHAISA